MLSRILVPIICALHFSHPSIENTHPEQWADIFAEAPVERLGVRCLTPYGRNGLSYMTHHNCSRFRLTGNTRQNAGLFPLGWISLQRHNERLKVLIIAPLICIITAFFPQAKDSIEIVNCSGRGRSQRKSRLMTNAPLQAPGTQTEASIGSQKPMACKK